MDDAKTGGNVAEPTLTQALAGITDRVVQKAAVDPVTVFTVVTLLIQLWMECRGYPPTPEGLRKFATEKRERFRRRTRGLLRREGVERTKLRACVDEIQRQVLSEEREDVERLAACFAEVAAAGRDTGEWPAVK